MYVTLKIRLKPDENAKEYLLLYEDLYHKCIYKVMEDMCRSGNISFASQHIDSSVDRDSQWNLFQQALKKYQAYHLKKNSLYLRSSTWNTKSFRYYDGTLILYFGTKFPIAQLNLPVSIIRSEDEQIRNSRMIRLDITHDEKFWFANFVIQTE